MEAEGVATHGPQFKGYTAFTMNGWPGSLYDCSNGKHVPSVTLHRVKGIIALKMMISSKENLCYATHGNKIYK